MQSRLGLLCILLLLLLSSGLNSAFASGVREGKICCAVSGAQQICQPRRGATRLKLTKKQRGCEILACTNLEEAAKAAGQPGVLVPSISLHHAQASGRHHAVLRRVLGWFWGVLRLWCSITGWAKCHPALSQKARLEIQCENAMEINAKCCIAREERSSLHAAACGRAGKVLMG